MFIIKFNDGYITWFSNEEFDTEDEAIEVAEFRVQNNALKTKYEIYKIEKVYGG